MQRFVLVIFIFGYSKDVLSESMMKLFSGQSAKKIKNDRLFDMSLKNEAYIIRPGRAPAIKAKDGAD